MVGKSLPVFRPWTLVVFAAPLVGISLTAQTPSKSDAGAKRDFGALRRYEVSAVVDSGTLTLQRDGKRLDVHLVGIDVADSDDDALPAVAFLEHLLTGEPVFVESAAHAAGGGEASGPVAATQRSDDAQKSESHAGGGDAADAPAIADGGFAYVYRAPDGLFVNLELIRQGYIRVSARPKFDQLETFRGQEKRARAAGRGVWGGDRPRGAPESKSGERDRKKVEKPGPSDVGGKTGDANAGVTVYVTKSGKKYHKQGCQFITQGAAAMSIADAIKKGLEPCSRCKPPVKP